MLPMLYVVIGREAPGGSSRRAAVRERHLHRLADLQSQGRLLLAGPLPAIDGEDPGPCGFDGSLVIAEFANLDTARRWAEQDPYVEAGVFDRVDVRPFKQTLP